MGAFRRATGQRISHFEDWTKGLIEAIMQEEGLSMIIERKNIKAWNEAREFFAVDAQGGKFSIGVCMKGERADWDGVARELAARGFARFAH